MPESLFLNRSSGIAVLYVRRRPCRWCCAPYRGAFIGSSLGPRGPDVHRACAREPHKHNIETRMERGDRSTPRILIRWTIRPVILRLSSVAGGTGIPPDGLLFFQCRQAATTDEIVLPVCAVQGAVHGSNGCLPGRMTMRMYGCLHRILYPE